MDGRCAGEHCWDEDSLTGYCLLGCWLRLELILEAVLALVVGQSAGIVWGHHRVTPAAVAIAVFLVVLSVPPASGIQEFGKYAVLQVVAVVVGR